MSFKTDHLRYFVAVAEEGQITRAAKGLYIAQPALSQAISQLESDLGLQLLERHPRGVRLTPAGEAFLEKARAVVDSEMEVRRTAQTLARAERCVLEIGFIGPPPMMTAPELFTAFSDAHPEAEVSFRDLPFPRGATSTWLEDVDVAFCHSPAPEASIRTQPVRAVPRTIVAHRSHPLAGRGDAEVADFLDERFIGYHPDVQPKWAGFHSLDDHRGGPPRELTGDRASTALQMLGVLGSRGAVTALPSTDAALVCHVLPEAVEIPLRDADPAVLSLVWAGADEHPLLESLIAIAGRAEPPVSV